MSGNVHARVKRLQAILPPADDLMARVAHFLETAPAHDPRRPKIEAILDRAKARKLAVEGRKS